MYVLPPSTMSSSLGSWDADFVKVDQAVLFDLILCNSELVDPAIFLSIAKLPLLRLIANEFIEVGEGMGPWELAVRTLVRSSCERGGIKKTMKRGIGEKEKRN
ncbi:hypothetical protein PVK06_028139 [Gossypium arboreum]|uniref:Uncharacterized protein n=1 Tax=Gossypium arboreum TaxID=29729 RepID=A0ABR0P258_GOSAR|nr:hypothetical protein PVK06_028139 [Gossypium arboreum]